MRDLGDCCMSNVSQLVPVRFVFWKHNLQTRLMAPDAVHRNTPLIPQSRPPRIGNHLCISQSVPTPLRTVNLNGPGLTRSQTLHWYRGQLMEGQQPNITVVTRELTGIRSITYRADHQSPADPYVVADDAGKETSHGQSAEGHRVDRVRKCWCLFTRSLEQTVESPNNTLLTVRQKTYSETLWDSVSIDTDIVSRKNLRSKHLTCQDGRRLSMPPQGHYTCSLLAGNQR